MADLSLYKVDLDTPQSSGRTGESPRAAFTKYNEALEEIEGGFVPAQAGKGLSTNDYDNAAWGAVNGMGSAASRDVTESPTDTAVGRLLKVGDFGIGSSTGGSLSDYNVRMPSGLYSYSTSATPSPGGGFRMVLNAVNDSGGGFQLAGRTVNNDFSIRSIAAGGSEAPFVDLYHTGNAVSPVSQVGGVPTGGIAQKGVNPNGSFTRLLDGTLIMRKTHTVGGNGTDEILLHLTFPTASVTTACIGFSVSVFGTVDIRVAEFRIPFIPAGGNEALIKFKFNQIVPTNRNIEMTFTVSGTWY